MARVLKYAIHAFHDGDLVTLLPGQEVPDWARDLIGPHAYDDDDAGPVDPASVKSLEGSELRTGGSFSPLVEQPAGNASREEWAAWAKAHGAPDEETAEGGLSRNELRDNYSKS